MGKSIAKNSIFNLIYNALNVLFPFITGIYVSHVLLSGDIGEFEAAKNLSQYFVILAFLGIPTYGLREIAKARKDKDQLSKTYSELMVINFISSILFTGVYVVLISSIPAYRNHFLLYLITGGSIALNVINNSWLYEGLEEFSYICIRNLIVKILCFAGLVIFVRKPDDYLFYAIITVFGMAGNYVFNIIHSRRFVKFTFKNLNLKKHMKPILFLVVVNLAIEIYTLVDITMLKLLSTKESIAYYSYGSKIYKILLQMINTLTIVVVPRLAYYFKNKDQKSFNQLVSKALNIIVLIALPSIIGIYFVSKPIVAFMYGTEYVVSASVLQILSISLLVSPIGYLLGSRVLLVTDNEKKMVIPVAVGAVLNVIANYFLIKQFSEIGAAIASVSSELVVVVIYLFLSKKYFKLDGFIKNFLKILSASIAMLLFLLVIHFANDSSLLIKTLREIIIGVSIYFFVLFALKEYNTIEYSNRIIDKLFHR